MQSVPKAKGKGDEPAKGGAKDAKKLKRFEEPPISESEGEDWDDEDGSGDEWEEDEE